MERRKFLLGVGSAAAGGSALLGTGAFSRVESQRDVTVQVANDRNAYLGMKPLDTPNSNNYVELDELGHLTVDIGEHDDFTADPDGAAPGEGVNSDSYTYFDGMFELCNQGKQNACVSYLLPDGVVQNDVDEQTVTFYYVERNNGEVTNRRMVEAGEKLPLELGECTEIGVRTVTVGIDADNTPLIDGDVIVTADVTEYDDSGGTSTSTATAQRGEPSALQEVSTQSLGITDLSASGLDPTGLANELLAGGSGISISSVNFVGEDVQGGTFGSGAGILGVDEGIILSSGDVNDVVGPNEDPGTTTNHGNPGDSDLDTLTPGNTFDAAVLEFEFTVPEGTSTVGFNYVFGSEEYNEYVGSEFNDVFGFFLNGTNVAVVDNPDGPGTIPAAINNINEGNGGSPATEPTNPDLYINNDPVNPNFDGETVASEDLLDTEMDGLTVVLDIEDEVNDGPGETNTLKIGVADTSDRILDSWVLLEAGSFETDPDPEPDPDPDPSPCS